MPHLASSFLQSATKTLASYKSLGDKTLQTLSEADLHYTPDPCSNSIAVIIRHLAGNMHSRWTDFLTTDGEKDWRNRDAEFDTGPTSKEALIEMWENGWACCLDAFHALKEPDLQKTIYIRSEGLLVLEAINRQLAHYPYHVGQMIYIAKMIQQQHWQSLSIPRNQSVEYNRRMQEGK